jgi:DNA-binding MarR family transcriptional regulator
MPTHHTPSGHPRLPQRTESDVAASVNAFRRVLREIRVMARKGELSTGPSPAQNFVLSVLVESPGASVNELAEATLTDRSSVAAVVDRLVDQGYAVREQSADDRRRASVSITAMGRRAMRQAASPPPTVALIHAIRSLGRDEQRSLAAGLTALARAMGVDQHPAGMLFEDAAPRGRRSATRRRR